MSRIRDSYHRVASDLKSTAAVEPQAVLERNIRINVYHGVLSQTALNLAQPFIGIFAVKNGATDLQVGLLSSGPALISLLSMIPGGLFMDRQTSKKRAIMTMVFLQRLFYLAISTIPFFTADRRAWLLVFAVTFMNIPASIGNIGWQAFISRLIPPARRAEAFAARNRLMNVVGTLAVLVTGRVIDILGFPFGYQMAFAGAVLVTVAEAWVFWKLDDCAVVEPPPEAARAAVTQASSSQVRTARPAGFVAAIREIFSHTRFMRYVIASMGFYLCWQAPWPLFTLYQVKELGANNTWVSLLNLANTGGSLVGYGFWVRQMNRHGNLKTLFMSTLGIFVVPLAYAFSRSLATVAAFNLLTGAIFSGVNLALFNALLEVTPDERKTTYIAYYTTAVNAAAIFAPMIGVGLLNMLGFFWAFISTAILRIIGSFAFLLVFYLDRRDLARASAQQGQHGEGMPGS